MLKPANVAAPFTAFTEPPPDSEPPPGFALRASVIAPLKLATLFSDASSALTFTAGVIVAPTCVLVGGMLNARCVAGGGVPAATTRSTGTRAGLPTACSAELPLATLTRTRPGATVRAAAEGGLLISLSSLQVVRRTASTDTAAPIAQRLVTGRLRDLWIP